MLMPGDVIALVLERLQLTELRGASRSRANRDHLHELLLHPRRLLGQPQTLRLATFQKGPSLRMPLLHLSVALSRRL